LVKITTSFFNSWREANFYDSHCEVRFCDVLAMLLDVYVVYLMQIFLVCWMQVFFVSLWWKNALLYQEVWKEVSLVLVILGGGFLLHRQHDRKDGPHFGEISKWGHHMNSMGDEKKCIQLLKLCLLQPHDFDTNLISIWLKNFHP